MKKYALNPDDMRPRRRPSPETNSAEHEKHVPVRDASSQFTREEPLSAYMVSPQYLPRDVIMRTAPKRPLGQPAPQPMNRQTGRIKQVRPARTRRQRQPLTMHNRVATFGSLDRVRRPRFQPSHHIPVVEEASDQAMGGNAATKIGDYITAAAAVIGAALILVWDKAAAAGRFIVSKFRGIRFGRANVRYSAVAGAMYNRFGVRDNWLRISVPVVIVLFLLGMGLFSAFNNGGNTPGGASGGNQANGNNSGGTALQTTPSADHAQSAGSGKNGTAAKTGGAGATTATGAATPSGGAGTNSGGSTAGTSTGGMGGGGSTEPILVGSGAPTYGPSSSTVTQVVPVYSAPAPTASGGSTGGSGGGSSGGSTSGGTSGGSGGGITLPLNPPTTPLPTTTVTLPPTDVTSGDKTIVSTSPISGTLN